MPALFIVPHPNLTSSSRLSSKTPPHLEVIVLVVTLIVHGWLNSVLHL